MPGKNSTSNMITRLRTTAVYLLTVALLVWAGLDVYQRYQFYQGNNITQEAKPTTANADQQQTISNTNTVASEFLFGKKVDEKKTEALTLAPATKLNLKLIGVITTPGERASKVIIQIGASDVDVFSIGDKLPKGNATIEKIEVSQVLLRRNGKLESLSIIRPELENEISELSE